jgi:hypothetical protein
MVAYHDDVAHFMESNGHEFEWVDEIARPGNVPYCEYDDGIHHQLHTSSAYCLLDPKTSKTNAPHTIRRPVPGPISHLKNLSEH